LRLAATASNRFISSTLITSGSDPRAFAAYLAPLWNTNWVVYCKRPFGGPKEVLHYLARYTHRVAISNRRLIACDEKGVTFKWKDYRIEATDQSQLWRGRSLFLFSHAVPRLWHADAPFGFS
jgi:Putative transposase